MQISRELNMNKTKLTSNSLYEQQFEKLLNELSQILNKTWPLLVNDGQESLKKIAEIYEKLYDQTDRADDDTESSDDDDNDEQTLKLEAGHDFLLNKYPLLNSCNEQFAKLDEILTRLEYNRERLTTLGKNLDNVVELVNGEVNFCINPTEFKTNLTYLVHDYENDFKLKSQIVKRLLNQTRHDRYSRVTILSMWIHQPYLNELLFAKINCLIQSYFNKN